MLTEWTHAALSAHPGRADQSKERLAAPWISGTFVVIWGLWAAAFNTAQFGDNIEQFNWSHSLEWGYYKHPPMPTWLLGAVIHLFGPSRWWAIALAALCALVTAALTLSIARQLIGPRPAAAMLLLWSMQLCFSARVQLYNHNTVLIVFIAATVWCTLRAHRGGPGWWIAAGACAGAAMLSKYQALVPLGGLLLALGWTGRLRSAPQRRGLVLAALVALLAFAPHAAWVVGHDLTTLRYASQSYDPESFGHRLWVLIAFAANQVRMIFPALAAVLICALLTRFGARTAPIAEAERDGLSAAEVRIWLSGLIWAPLLVLVALDLAAGVTLRNHWGVQTMQFIALWMAYRWQRVLLGDLRRLIIVAIAVQLVGLGLYAVQQRDPDAMLSRRRMDTSYPAQRMADVAMTLWQQVTACPLRFVVGPSFPAGLVSLYSGGTSAVFEGRIESPWVDPQDLERFGSIYVAEDGMSLPDGLATTATLSLTPEEKVGHVARTITLGVRPPARDCR